MVGAGRWSSIMPVFFAMQSTSQPLTARASADTLAEIIQDALTPYDVRVVSIRRAGTEGFVFGCAARQRPQPGTLVGKLRNDRRLARFRFSDEAPTSEGPFG